MKIMALMTVILTAAAVAAAGDPPTKDKFQVKKKSSRVNERQAASNEAVRKSVSLDGVAVQCTKADRPVQLVNPLAPAQYGNGEQNVVRDPVDGKVRGLKFFSVRF